MSEHVEFVSNAVSGLHIRDIAKNIDSLIALRPNLVVLQIGIIECTRRILSRFEKHVLYGIPLTRPLTRYLRKKRTATIRIRDLLRITVREIHPGEFEKSISFVKTRLEKENIRVVFVCIPHYPKSFEDELYGLNDDIDMYNAILNKFCGVHIFNDNENLEEFYNKGTVHFTCRGHDEVAKRMLNIINVEIEKMHTDASA